MFFVWSIRKAKSVLRIVFQLVNFIFDFESFVELGPRRVDFCWIECQSVDGYYFLRKGFPSDH